MILKIAIADVNGDYAERSPYRRSARVWGHDTKKPHPINI